jgi:hypothetical protein
MEALWESIIADINSLYCQVHRISTTNPLFMTMMAAIYSLPKYLQA